ncbi:hypothetical protein GGI35DRAFT_464390 [Trichoderma velutinum]
MKIIIYCALTKNILLYWSVFFILYFGVCVRFDLGLCTNLLFTDSLGVCGYFWARGFFYILHFHISFSFRWDILIIYPSYYP